MYDSSEGPAISIEKLKSNPDGEIDGQTLTELELTQQFNHDIPMSIRLPQWSTLQSPYPEVEYLAHRDHGSQSDIQVPFQVPPLGLFILRQFIRAERTRLSSGSVSVKVFLTNHFTDGNIEHKEIIDNPCSVLEEQDKLYLDFKNRKKALVFAIVDDDYESGAAEVKEYEEYEEGDFD